jgi:alkanesulfonate monooxygenase
MQAHLELGWYLPTSGDTTCYGDRDKFIQPSADLFDRVILAAEAAGFEYFLVPVAPTCWEAWISSAMAVAKTRRIKALVAARLGYNQPGPVGQNGRYVRAAFRRPPGCEPDRRAERCRGTG